MPRTGRSGRLQRRFGRSDRRSSGSADTHDAGRPNESCGSARDQEGVGAAVACEENSEENSKENQGQARRVGAVETSELER
jgi:hypothetical protein